jgi:hypothetical protein
LFACLLVCFFFLSFGFVVGLELTETLDLCFAFVKDFFFFALVSEEVLAVGLCVRGSLLQSCDHFGVLRFWFEDRGFANCGQI